MFRKFLAPLLALLIGSHAEAASLTPPNLTAATTISNADLLVVWPTLSGGPLESVTWAVTKSLMQTALGTVYLQVSNNLSDVSSAATARSNLGLGSAAVQNTGSSGTVVPLLSGNNTWGGTQTFGTKPFFPTSTTSIANWNAPTSAASPTSPVNGDFWNLGGVPKWYDGSTTQTLAYLSSNITGSAAKLATARTIAESGDVVWSTSFDGSANVTAAATIQAGVVTGSKIANTTVAAANIVNATITTTQIASSTIANSNLATMGSNTIKANVTGGTTNPSDVAVSTLCGTSGNTFACGNDGRFGGPTQNLISSTSNYTFVLSDAGKEIYCRSLTTCSFTIPAHASVAYPIGTKIELVSCSTCTVTLTINSDQLYWSPSGSLGSRTLAGFGIATATQIENGVWLISGTGIS